VTALAHPFLSWPTLALAGTAFLLGCRHGFDWDHVAAITDLTAASRTDDGPAPARSAPAQGRRLGLALWYCIGHGSVIVIFGIAIGVLGLHLPAMVDRVFESVVGATLVVLGAFVLWQLGRDGADYRYSGRIRILVGGVRRAWARARRRGAGPSGPLDDLNPRSAFAVGVLHGTGAETPTQVLLFAGAATSGSRTAAVVLMLSFVAGMVLADLGIAASWLVGLLGVRAAPRAQIFLGSLTGMSSLAIGGVFLAGRSTLLPALFGG
jgi:high-affinity nickel-transport protein